MAMSPNQARVIDPILTNHSRGYTQSGYIGDRLLPVATMRTRAAKRIEFGRESFRRYNIRRAPGARIAQVSFGYEGKPVSLSQYALQGVTPVEHQQEAQEVPGIDILSSNIDMVLAVIALEKEIQQAAVVRAAGTYQNSNKVALAGAAKWSHADSDPGKDVEAAKEVVRARTGRRSNRLALGATVASALRVHPKIREHYKHTTSSTITNAMLQAYFDVAELLVGDAIYDNADNQTVDVWGGDAVLAWVPPEGTPNINIPAFGYTYRLDGHPYVKPARYDDDVNSWLNDVFDEWSPEVVGPDAGFLFQAAV